MYEANKGRSFLDPRHIITHLDVAVRLGRTKRCQNGICLWPKSQDGNVYVPYKTSSSFQFMDLAYLGASFSELEGSTCVRFIPQTTETDYISFENLQGCWSSIGCVGGAQTVSLGKPGCMWTGIMTHEIMHALGLHHEHVRMDRSQYINVLWQNILSDYKSNFEESFTLNLNLSSYDYGSLMHYEGTAFSIDGISPTIVAIPYNNVSFGQRSEMSQLDIVKINTLYNCSCGGNFTAASAIITSPNYPKNYPSSAYCVWNITTTAPFSVTFTYFDIENAINCEFDSVKIYRGPSPSKMYLMDSHCGQTLPRQLLFYTNSVQIVLTTDDSVQNRGFRLVYQKV
ncbi:astacin-like metalloendopeptidase [Pelobates cultripes]|uniref:Metalloendopeptidase n=1 Tax=Pelobates cultripes TaxID=61616 RepID=A0AAD1SQ28_PELCU|nr:astacin-like metalloendopeptidase [Pelobates cultripes]